MRVSNIFFASIFQLFCIIHSAYAYSSGAPNCAETPSSSSMGYGSAWNAQSQGYKIDAKSNSNGDVTVTISGPASSSIKGFSVMASSGTFDVSDDRFQAIDCDPKKQVTHTSGVQKVLPLTFVWKNTASVSSVSFVTAIVQSTKMWATLPKVDVALSSTGTTPEEDTDPTTPPPNTQNGGTTTKATGGTTTKATTTTTTTPAASTAAHTCLALGVAASVFVNV